MPCFKVSNLGIILKFAFYIQSQMKRYFVVFIIIIVFASCGEVSTNSAQVSNEDDMANYGKNLYETQCILCHGEKGNAKIAQAADLSLSKLDETAIGDRIYHGKGTMPAYKDKLGEPEINALSKYVISLRRSK